MKECGEVFIVVWIGHDILHFFLFLKGCQLQVLVRLNWLFFFFFRFSYFFLIFHILKFIFFGVSAS